MTEIISRKDAISRGLDRYFTGKPCKRGHISERKIKGWCVECEHIYNSSESAKAQKKLYNRNNRDKFRAYNKKYWKKISALPLELRPKRKRKSRTPEQKAQHATYMRERYRNNPAHARSINLKSYYGLSPNQYQEMLDAQGGKCAICREATVGNKARKNLFIDHCHSTDNVRGLLCGNCNNLLGHAKDNPQILQSAMDYLKRPHLICIKEAA